MEKTFLSLSNYFVISNWKIYRIPKSMARTRLFKVGYLGFLLLCAGCTPGQQKLSEGVYITHTGTKFHQKGCYYLGKKPIHITWQEAIERGYDPCKECKPGTKKFNTQR